MATIEIIPIIPFEDGVAAGTALGAEALRARTAEHLAGPLLGGTLGAMDRAELAAYVTARLETPPDYGRYPELEDIYPEKVDYLRGLAQGAGVSLAEAAVHSYVVYRAEIDHWYQVFQLQRDPGHCSGVVMIGPDGVLGGQSAESGPPPKPADWVWQPPAPYAGLAQLPTESPDLVLRRPRTGYIERWGMTSEKGVACVAGNSCGVWLDEPIEDTWPICQVPLLRFARDIDHLEELFRRYTLFNWGRGSIAWADVKGNAMIVEKSYRRIGIRRLRPGDHAIWCTEGHWETPEMGGYLRAKRLEYIEKMGRHLGADDLQYAADCAVRFAHIGELCHRPWGHGREHFRRIMTNHDTFPRAVCRHGGPDTDPYDESVTMGSSMIDLTHNRSYSRGWIPWQKFPCEVPETVTQYPAIPG